VRSSWLGRGPGDGDGDGDGDGGWQGRQTGAAPRGLARCTVERERKGEWREFGCSDGVRQWVEDGRPGRQHDIPLLTSKSRDSK
jgi:hypothetical protein